MPVEIYTKHGPRTYKLLSERLPEFLSRYAPEQGWQVIVEASDALSLRPGLEKLYASAFQAGRRPEELGLPDLRNLNVMVFQARLVSPDGKVVQTASALKAITTAGAKDWEKGETAARQRLVAACGLDGGTLDEDEYADMADQGLVPGQAARAPRDVPRPGREPGTRPGRPAPPQEAVVDLKQRRPQGAQRSAEGPAAAAATLPPADDPPPEALLRQLAHQARLKGVEAPQVQTRTEGKKELKRLMALPARQAGQGA